MNTTTHGARHLGASDALLAANRRIGLGPDRRVRWLVDFARRRLERPNRLQGETLASRWDALAFAYGPRPGLVARNAQPPEWTDVTKAWVQLELLVLQPLRNEEPLEAEWAGRLFRQPDGTFKAITHTADLSFVRAFIIQVYEALRETRLRIRFCPVCSRPFVAKRPDAKVCPVGSCRTIAWRRSHRDKFRATRRKAYERQMKRRTGNPNIRIGSRKMKEKKDG